MPDWRCNCENSNCKVCFGKGCNFLTLGTYKAMYVGAICMGCAAQMPAQYLLPPDKEA